MLNVIRQFVKEEEGLSAAEYAIICASVNHRGYDLQDSHCNRDWERHDRTQLLIRSRE